MENGRSKFKNEFKGRLYAWVLATVRLTDIAPKSASSTVMCTQLLRSSTSVLANYVEAQSASSKRDFVNFFTHSLKSANESKVWLTLLKDTGKGDKKAVDALLGELTEVANILADSILTMKGKR